MINTNYNKIKFTESNLAESLYIISKTSKKQRDIVNLKLEIILQESDLEAKKSFGEMYLEI